MTYSFYKGLWNAYCIPGTLLGMGNYGEQNEHVLALTGHSRQAVHPWVMPLMEHGDQWGKLPLSEQAHEQMSNGNSDKF